VNLLIRIPGLSRGSLSPFILKLLLVLVLVLVLVW
jgi:hypothetical protein